MIKSFWKITVIILISIPWYYTAYAQSTTNAFLNPEAEIPKTQVVKLGIASYYADKFHGRKTYGGELYQKEKFTAACNVLPLNTMVKVTNLKNNKWVIVKINDRMASGNKRLIDLSKSAAQKLSFISSGITKVKVEVVEKGELSLSQ